MDMNYCITTEMVLDPVKWAQYAKILREAGITRLWLNGYFFGHWEATMADLKAARDVLIRDHFAVGIMNLAVGHPGNSLDPSNPDVIVEIPKTWQYRIDSNGKSVLHCGDITDQMIEDNRNAVLQLQQAGFSTICLDDDIRMGNWGGKIEGCFCDTCVQKFNTQFQHAETRQSLSAKIKDMQNCQNASILQDWIRFNCHKLTQLIQSMALPGIQLQVMIMHYGDERHGIDISAIKAAVPNCWFRVGECHFSDRYFVPPMGKAKEFTGIQAHLLHFGGNRSFSETTEFPHGALSPSNWAYKAKMAVVAGIDEIFLMGTYKRIDQTYMAAIRDARAEIDALEQVRNHSKPTYMIHFATGTKYNIQNPFILPLQGVLGGLPACLVRSDDVISVGTEEILIIQGKLYLNADWHEKLSQYMHILVDSSAWSLNRTILAPYQQIISHIPIFHSLTHKMEYRYIAFIRRWLEKKAVKAPFLIAGKDIGLVWYRETESVIVFNLQNRPNNCQLHWDHEIQDLGLNPLEFRIIHKKK